MDRTVEGLTSQRDDTAAIPITELARIVRSKNSGPFELTFDVVFKDAASYELAAASDVFTPELFARLYGLDSADVIKVVFFEKAYAVKATIVRPTVSGGLGETDVYGAQQHAPLLGITIPRSVAESAARAVKESQ